MKKIIFILVAVASLTLSSCSKEASINRKLDGSWKAVTVDNQAVQSGESLEITFSKDGKDNGTGTSTYSFGSTSYATSFTYTLAEDKLTSVTTVGNTTSTDVVTVNTYTKDKIQWTNSSGEITVLEPK